MKGFVVITEQLPYRIKPLLPNRDTSILIEKMAPRNWVIATGKINITSLEFNEGDIFVDAQTAKVYVFAKDSIGLSAGVSFQLVELGYYSDFCNTTDYFENDTEPSGAVFGDRWLDTSSGTLYTLVKNAENQDVWAEIGQTSGVCENNNLFYSPNNPLETTAVSTGDRWYDVKTGAFYTYALSPAEQWIELR